MSAYEEVLRVEMANKGYEGYFKAKSRAHIAGIDRTKVFFFFAFFPFILFILTHQFSLVSLNYSKTKIGGWVLYFLQKK